MSLETLRIPFVSCRSGYQPPTAFVWRRERLVRITGRMRRITALMVVLDPAEGKLTGSEQRSPTITTSDTLTYLWLQLDVNRFREDSLANRSATRTSVAGSQSIDFIERLHVKDELRALDLTSREWRTVRGAPLSTALPTP